MVPEQGGDDGSMFLPGMENLAPGGDDKGPSAHDDLKPTANPAPGTESEPGRIQSSGSEPVNGHDLGVKETRKTIAGMSVDANQADISRADGPQVALDSEMQSTALRPEPPYVEPLWMRRSKLVMFVMACIYLGIILILLPWNDVWIQNGLIHRYPALRDFAMNNFLRGSITGLGFVNVWLGVWEAVSYRERK